MPLTWFARELTSGEPTELKENAGNLVSTTGLKT